MMSGEVFLCPVLGIIALLGRQPPVGYTPTSVEKEKTYEQQTKKIRKRRESTSEKENEIGLPHGRSWMQKGSERTKTQKAFARTAGAIEIVAKEKKKKKASKEKPSTHPDRDEQNDLKAKEPRG